MKAQSKGALLKVVFAKRCDMRYISHLDLVRLFQRAARRADLAVELSRGFSPRPRIRFKRALKLGVESEAEEATFQLRTPLPPEDFKRMLERQLPEGIQIKCVEEIGI